MPLVVKQQLGQQPHHRLHVQDALRLHLQSADQQDGARSRHEHLHKDSNYWGGEDKSWVYSWAEHKSWGHHPALSVEWGPQAEDLLLQDTDLQLQLLKPHL
jgi:hypothetical protein